MGVRINVVGQKFLARLNNGDDFTINDTTDFALHLKGGVLEEIKAIFNVQVSWDLMIRGNTSSCYYDDVNGTFNLQIEGTDFENEGFSVGDDYKLNDINWTLRGVVTSITLGEMNMTATSGFLDRITANRFFRPSQPMYLTGTTHKTALKYDFGLIENNEYINFLSKLTNTNQTYLFEGIDHDNPLVFVDGITQGNNKAGYTGSARVAFVRYTRDNDQRVTENTTQEFQIEHIFKINPIYRDGDIDSLKGIDAPPLDIFNGDMSLKYVLQTEFRTVLSNPNTSMVADYDTQLGSVGYLDESYNGFDSDYTIEDLVYTNLTDSTTSERLDVGSINRVTFTVKSETGTIDPNIPMIVGHTSIIGSSTYANNPEYYNTIWLDQSLRATDGGGVFNGDIITNYEVNRIDNNTLTVTLDIEFTTTSQRNRLNENQDYLLYFTIADPNKTVDQGSKVTGRIDVNYYSKSGDIQGLFDLTVFEQYPIPYDFDIGVTTGFTSGKMFIEDEQFSYARIKLLNTYLGEDGNLLEDVNLETLNFKIVAYNTVDNSWFDIRSLSVDLSDQIVSGNIQNIELNTNRGYILTDIDIFNSLKMSTDTNDGTYQYYDLEIGYKVPWQDWLELIGADTIFLDRSLSQNGLNQNSSNYSGLNNYVIKILIDANVETTGVSTNYVKPSGDFLSYNYNTDDQNPDAYSCVINTFNEDRIPILNNIIESGYTELRSVITPLTPPEDVGAVDMTEVDDTWNRFAHGNKITSGTSFPRTGNWFNEQAKDDNDKFSEGGGTATFTKSSDLYTSETSTIKADENCLALYGCYSLSQYEFYSITGAMFSNEADDDVIVYNICFMTDEFGVEHSLSLCLTTGGFVLDLGSGFIVDDPTTSVFDSATGQDATWALVYDYGKRGCAQLYEEFATGKNGLNWSQVGDAMFEVSRTANNIEVNLDWTITGDQFLDSFSYDLNANEYTKKFIGVNHIGFSFLSQSGGGFKDVVLSNPSSGYYAALRIEAKDSPSDFGMSEINTIIENTDTSLLKKITGEENKATLSFDGTNFIIQALVNTDQITDGEEYKFSSLLRRKDLRL